MFREALLQARREVVAVETSIGTTYIRSLTAGEKDDLDRNFNKDGKLRCRLVLLSLCREDGTPEFDSNRDLPAIDQVPLAVIEPIVDAALVLNKMGPKEAEALAKN